MADTAEDARRYARTLREIKLHGVADAMDNYAALLEAQHELLRRLRAAEADAERLRFYAENPERFLLVGSVWYHRKNFNSAVRRASSLNAAIDAERKP